MAEREAVFAKYYLVALRLTLERNHRSSIDIQKSSPYVLVTYRIMKVQVFCVA